MKVGDRVSFTHTGVITTAKSTGSVLIRDDDNGEWWVNRNRVTVHGPETVLDGDGDKWTRLSNGKYALAYNVEDCEASIRKGVDSGKTLDDLELYGTVYVPRVKEA